MQYKKSARRLFCVQLENGRAVCYVTVAYVCLSVHEFVPRFIRVPLALLTLTVLQSN